MRGVFPELSINRVDVKKQSIKIFASIDTVNPSVRPFWLDDEDFAPFINCSFLFVLDAEGIEGDTREVTLNNFPEAQSVFEWIRTPTNRIYNLSTQNNGYYEDFIKNITLEEIRQNPYGASPGDSISRDFVSNKIHFEVDINFSDFDLGEIDGVPIVFDLETVLENAQSNRAFSLIYYSHVNYREIESNYGIGNGQSEVRRLGGMAKYLPLAFFDASSRIFKAPDPNLVSIQIQQDGETPFEGYYGLPSILMHQDDQDSPAALPGGGLPDTSIWRSRINYDSIYGSSDRIDPYITERQVVDRIKKQLALRTVEDHSFALTHYITWNSRRRTVDQDENRNPNTQDPVDRTLLQEQTGEVDAYSSMFVLDVLKVLTRMSPVGFLLDRDFSKLELAELTALIEKCLQRSALNIKITRKKLSKSSTNFNKVTTADYEILHSKKDAFIVHTQKELNNGVAPPPGDFAITEDFVLEEVLLVDRDIENLNFLFSKIFNLHDKGLFLRGKQGEKYKYFIELSISDGIPKVLQSDYINPIKNHIAEVKNLLALAETPLERTEDGTVLTPGNYNFLTNQWSEEFLAATDFQFLENAIIKYVSTLKILGIETQQDLDQLIDSILPTSNASLDSLELFYKSLVQVESILVTMYDKITNHEVGLAGELYSNKKMVPSNQRTNIINACFYTDRPITIEKRETMIADFGRLDLTLPFFFYPREIYLELFSHENGRIVSGPLMFQHSDEGRIAITREVQDKIPQYDFFLDYINKAQRSNPFFPIDNELVPAPESRPADAWPLNLDLYKTSVASIANYLPSTTFEIPSVNRSFRSSAEGLSEDNDGLESLAYSNLEDALLEGYRQNSDLENYITDLENNQSTEGIITYFTLDDVGPRNLETVFKVMKTIERFQEEYDALSPDPTITSPVETEESFAAKYFPRTKFLKGITRQGTTRLVGGPDDLEDIVFLYIDNTDEQYKKLNFTIVNTVAVQ